MKLNDKLYDFLKWTGLILCPALAVLLATVLPVWGVDEGLVKALVITLNAVGVFIGALIGISQATIATETAKEEYFEAPSDDEVTVSEKETEDEGI